MKWCGQAAAMLGLRARIQVPGIDEKPAPLKKIGILGAGLMGGGIAMCFIQKGVPVVLKAGRLHGMALHVAGCQAGVVGWRHEEDRVPVGRTGEARTSQQGEVPAVYERLGKLSRHF